MVEKPGLIRKLVLPTLASKVRPSAYDRSRRLAIARWQMSEPIAGLTLGAELSGAPFVERLLKYAHFGDQTRVLEIGPGYGRLLKTLLEREVKFQSYLGLDLSPRNVELLNSHYGTPRIRFRVADVESVLLDEPVDVFYASLTFQHFYPTFAPHLKNLLRQSRPGAVGVFDLLERRWYHPFSSYFERVGDNLTDFVRVYRRAAVEKLVSQAGGRVVGFDTVPLKAKRDNLLVIATKS